MTGETTQAIEAANGQPAPDLINPFQLTATAPADLAFIEDLGIEDLGIEDLGIEDLGFDASRLQASLSAAGAYRNFCPE